MEILKVLSQKGGERGIFFVLVGGIALSAHGVSRQTGDVDLLIRVKTAKEWQEILEGLGYRIFHDHPAFKQFSPPRIDAWPVDLMMVNDETFDNLWREGEEHDLGKARVLVPNVEHLLALKIHALKQDLPFRKLKDLDDIVGLMECGSIDAEDPNFHGLCMKYGTQEIYEQIQEIWKKRRGNPSSK